MSGRKSLQRVDLEIREERRRILERASQFIELLLEKFPIEVVKEIVEGVYGKNVTREALVRLGLAQRD